MNDPLPLPTLEQLLDSPCTSEWMKRALPWALERDCLDALKDVELLHEILVDKWHQEIIKIN